MGYRQVIIARKDIMSPGKLAAQVSHASMAFLTNVIRMGAFPVQNSVIKNWVDVDKESEIAGYAFHCIINKDLYEQWIDSSFTKTVCEAKNKNHLLKAVKIAEDLGLKEGKDYFLIKDNCLTELEPEEIDENGVGRTLTCIGFKPLPDDVAHQISKKFQLYK